MTEPFRHSYTNINPQIGNGGYRPLLPIKLSRGSNSAETNGLVDSGSSLCVIPYQMGLDLGAVWNDQTISLSLAGNLAQLEARALLLEGKVSDFDPVKLAFAWAKTDSVPVILGQTNFFMQFDVCFYGSQLQFEIRPKD
jgi:hypothetical protein